MKKITMIIMILIIDLVCGCTKSIEDKNLEQELFNSLITSDNTYGLYFENKVTSNDINSTLIEFGIKSYLLDNNIDYTKGLICGTEVNETTTYKIPKIVLTSYLNIKFNTTTDYAKATNINGSYFENSTDVFDLEDNWGLTCFAKGGADVYLNHKLVKSEEDKENIYIYDKMVSCIFAEGSNTCVSLYPEETIIDCSYEYGEDGGIINDDCPIKDNATLENMSNYALNKLSSKLHTFKHTFKKIKGNYYWFSSEIIS